MRRHSIYSHRKALYPGYPGYSAFSTEILFSSGKVYPGCPGYTSDIPLGVNASKLQVRDKSSIIKTNDNGTRAITPTSLQPALNEAMALFPSNGNDNPA